MRQATVILLLFLIVKSSVGMDVSQLFSGDCCRTEINAVETMDNGSSPLDGDSDDCCDFGNCHCLCCVHTMINEKPAAIELIHPVVNFHVDFHYKNHYKLLYQNLVWHPPQAV